MLGGLGDDYDVCPNVGGALAPPALSPPRALHVQQKWFVTRYSLLITLNFL